MTIIDYIMLFVLGMLCCYTYTEQDFVWKLSDDQLLLEHCAHAHMHVRTYTHTCTRTQSPPLQCIEHRTHAQISMHETENEFSEHVPLQKTYLFGE